MEAAGWVTAALAGIAGVVSLLGYLFDQVPPLALFAHGAAAPATTLSDFAVSMLSLSFKLALRLAVLQ